MLGHHLFAISFEATTTLRAVTRYATGGLVVAIRDQRSESWRAFHACALPERRLSSRTSPALPLASHSGDEGLFAVARIAPDLQDVTSVRLRLSDGRQIEADAENEFALFFVERDDLTTPLLMPVAIEMLAGRTVVATQAKRNPLAEPKAEKR